MGIKAKFNVTALTKYGNGGGGNVKLAAVIGNSEENKEFWKYTPTGTIEMHIDNEEALKQFEGMGEYHVEFTKAE
jgi:cystathionine beta-lyase/cystathionine gamma-synthase